VGLRVTIVTGRVLDTDGLCRKIERTKKEKEQQELEGMVAQ
jgi:hypothetical protein